MNSLKGQMRKEMFGHCRNVGRAYQIWECLISSILITWSINKN